MMALVRLERLTKRYGDLAVIEELDLTIKDGEFFTVVGPSGCGKSTLLNMIAGLEPVTNGKIYFDDVSVNDLSPRDRDVAMVFQSYALYPHMNIFDNIAFPLRMKKTPRDTVESEVKRVASTLGIEGMLQRKPKELSGGQMQRAALGRAIIRKPKVFLMDEPLSNLDARLRVEMRAELKRLHQELKITTVYVTHDQAEAMGLSERIAVLHQGALQQCGTPLDVFFRPSNIFVGGFIGSPPMNFIKARVKNRQPFEIDCNGLSVFPELEVMPGGDTVITGIRPDDVSVSETKSEGSREVTIYGVEPSGPFSWVDVAWDSVRLKGKMDPGETVRPGVKAFMRFPLERVIVFDKAGKMLAKLK